MARPAKYPWKRIFEDLAGGVSEQEVCDRYDLSLDYLRKTQRRRESRARKAPEPTPATHAVAAPPTPPPASPRSKPSPTTRSRGPDNVLPMPTARRETREERRARRAEEMAQERERAKTERIVAGATAAGLDRPTLIGNIQQSNQALSMALLSGDSRAARDLSMVLVQLTEKMGAILAVEEHFAEPEPELDLTSPEGQQQLAGQLNGSPRLLSLCDVEVLEAALELARDRQRRQA